MKWLRGLAWAVGGASVVVMLHAQVNLAPVPPADLTSPQHQVRQDAAIESLALEVTTTQAEVVRRLDRLEHLVDGIVLALIALVMGQMYTNRRARR